MLLKHRRIYKFQSFIFNEKCKSEKKFKSKEKLVETRTKNFRIGVTFPWNYKESCNLTNKKLFQKIKSK